MSRGKQFSEEEDRFLVCMTSHLGYGRWDELAREVRSIITRTLSVVEVSTS